MDSFNTKVLTPTGNRLKQHDFNAMISKGNASSYSFVE
jgi:hypothetical protein